MSVDAWIAQKVAITLCLCLFGLSAPGGALADKVESVTALRAELAALSRRIASLEKQIKALDCGTNELVARGAPITETRIGRSQDDRILVDGDFRYRYETIDLQGSERHTRSRIRARASVEGDLGQGFRIGAGLATGGTSPVSSTQTLGKGGSKKAIALDLAFVDWSPLDGLHLLAGKFRNPLFQVPSETLLWDDEWRPEGVGVTYDHDRLFATILGTWLESDSLAPAREFAVAGHAGIRQPLGPTRLTAGLGYVDIGTAGKAPFYEPDSGFTGNTVDCTDPQIVATCTYRHDYRQVETFAALDFDVNALAAQVYGHYVRNLDASQSDSGWTAGTRVHMVFQDRPLQLDYFYRDLGADAVYGALTDSDFGGGGTDAKGHYLKAGWSVHPKWVLSLTYFRNRVGIDAGDERDYDRLQLTADFRY